MIKKLVLCLLFISKTHSWTTKTNKQCDVTNSVDISSGIRLPDGIVFEGVKYKYNEHYYDNVTKTERGCICLKKSCYRKCCPAGSRFDSGLKCVPSTSDFKFVVWNEANSRIINVAPDSYHVVHGFPNCSVWEDRITMQVSVFTDNFHIREDGKLFVDIESGLTPFTLFDPDKYCLETFVRTLDNGTEVAVLDAVACFDVDEPSYTKYYLNIACMLTSCFFILLTLIVYLCLPELQTLHGRTMIAYLFCFFVGFFCFALMEILLILQKLRDSDCIVFTMFNYFSLTAAFFWLNIMCYDIWWTFSGKRGRRLDKSTIKNRFIYYSLYAFGVPFLLTVILAGLEFSGLSSKDYFLPDIRKGGCFLEGTRQLFYFYGPISIICASNIVFFSLTIHSLVATDKKTSILNSSDSARHRNDKLRLLQYIKLFLIMGISWILEIISAIFPDVKYIWYATDTYNLLIGLIIFIVLVCKRNILKLVKKRFGFSDDRSQQKTISTDSRSMSASRDEKQQIPLNRINVINKFE